MSNLKIEVRFDLETDIELIKKYFFSSQEDFFKKRILRFYKDLAEKAVGPVAEIGTIVENYFRGIYSKREDEIKKIVDDSRQIIDKKASDCLDVLVDLMDYKSKKEEVFIAIQTLLPFSPFDRPVFYFSIAPTLFVKDSSNEFLDIAIHEISHFLFFDTLNLLEINLMDSQPECDFLHLFKESLTGMLLSEKEFSQLLGRKNYKGNNEVQNLNVMIKTGEVVSLREFLRENFHQFRERGSSFPDFLKEMILILSPKIQEFSGKKVFWNKNEQRIRTDNFNSELAKIYAEPIII